MKLGFIDRLIHLWIVCQRLCGNWSRGESNPHTNANTTGNTNILKEGGAECGAQRAPNSQFDHDLQHVIDVWKALPDAIRAGILAMVKDASGDRGKA